MPMTTPQLRKTIDGQWEKWWINNRAAGRTGGYLLLSLLHLCSFIRVGGNTASKCHCFLRWCRFFSQSTDADLLSLKGEKGLFWMPVPDHKKIWFPQHGHRNCLCFNFRLKTDLSSCLYRDNIETSIQEGAWMKTTLKESLSKVPNLHLLANLSRLVDIVGFTKTCPGVTKYALWFWSHT